MSKTIRDNAQQAALSMMANEVLYATCRLTYKDVVAKDYIYKVSGKVLKEVILRLEQNRLAMVEAQTPIQAKAASSPIDIETILAQTSTAMAEPKADPRIMGVVSSDQKCGFNIVEIITLQSYLSISDLETPLSSLKYITTIIDPNQAIDAQKRENSVVDSIARKLQEQAGSNFAINLLGVDAYKELTDKLNIDNTDKTQ